ncbi:MAG: SMC-Scp complex subunit ScpB [Pseudopedobacter saltans]|uniref:SMC-Scp complex subunit ScpB n=1 Tax=Pseudopedobacter saltans TaxID=151895 RepID=A0A2W5F9U3_9SPHI|nr:MAG: SMC-Scp complex subunit ScpB [Pseudopedobacter saltans]
MEIAELIPHIEALIFASDRPLATLEIVELLNNTFGFMDNQITLDQVENGLEGITEKYQSEFYAFQPVQSGGGWIFLTKPEYHATISQLNGDKFIKKLSGAALETLSIIAYKQPVTKGEIESIRGVNSDYSVQKLLEKELIVISGRDEDSPGKPLLYTTSKNFMDYFGINSSQDLPKIQEVQQEESLYPSIVDADKTTEAGDAPKSALNYNENQTPKETEQTEIFVAEQEANNTTDDVVEELGEDNSESQEEKEEL